MVRERERQIYREGGRKGIGVKKKLKEQGGWRKGIRPRFVLSGSNFSIVTRIVSIDLDCPIRIRSEVNALISLIFVPKKIEWSRSNLTI